MVITTQDGKKIEARAVEVEKNVIRCKFPKKNQKVVLGTYSDMTRAMEIFGEMYNAGKKGIAEFEMPKE